MKDIHRTSFPSLFAAGIAAVVALAAAGILFIGIGQRLKSIAADRLSSYRGMENLRQGFREISHLPGTFFIQSGGPGDPALRQMDLARAEAGLGSAIAGIERSRLPHPQRQYWVEFETAMLRWSRLAGELGREAFVARDNPDRLAAVARDGLPLLDTHRTAAAHALDALAEASLDRMASEASDAASDALRYGAVLLAGMALAALGLAMAAWRAAAAGAGAGAANRNVATETPGQAQGLNQALRAGAAKPPHVQGLQALIERDGGADIPESLPETRQSREALETGGTGETGETGVTGGTAPETAPSGADGSRGEFPLSVHLLRLHQAVFDIGWTLRQEMNARENSTPELDILRAVDMEATSRQLAEASFELMDVVEELAGYSAEAARPVFGTGKTRRLQ
jgi:hypothetical protein